MKNNRARSVESGEETASETVNGLLRQVLHMKENQAEHLRREGYGTAAELEKRINDVRLEVTLRYQRLEASIGQLEEKGGEETQGEDVQNLGELKVERELVQDFLRKALESAERDLAQALNNVESARKKNSLGSAERDLTSHLNHLEDAIKRGVWVKAELQRLGIHTE